MGSERLADDAGYFEGRSVIDPDDLDPRPDESVTVAAGIFLAIFMLWMVFHGFPN